MAYVFDRPVPPNIFFSKDVLLIPTLQDAGIEHSVLGALGKFRTDVKPGDWIDRGQLLLTVSFQYCSSEKPAWKWLERAPYTFDVDLRSPIAGFCVSRGVTNEIPILLLPRDEPPVDGQSVLQFFEVIGRDLKKNWRRLFLHEHEGRYIRANGATGHYGEAVRSAAAMVESFQEVKLGRDVIQPFDAYDPTLVRNVQWFRSQDLFLRDKLLHLVEGTSKSAGK